MTTNKMLSRITIVLAAGLVLGMESVETLARGGGGIMRCSLDGINTEHHGYIFGKKHLDVAKEYGFVKLSDGPGKHGTWGLDPSVCGRASLSGSALSR